MDENKTASFGVLNKRFLAQSVGLLNPPHPLTLNEKATLGDALLLLRNNKVGAVIVTDSEGRVSGMFTERDVVLKTALEEMPLSSSLKELMTKKPETIKMTTSVAFALQMMSEQGYRHLPIIDDAGYPVAIVSVKDLIDCVCRSLTKDLAAFGE